MKFELRPVELIAATTIALGGLAGLADSLAQKSVLKQAQTCADQKYQARPLCQNVDYSAAAINEHAKRFDIEGIAGVTVLATGMLCLITSGAEELSEGSEVDKIVFLRQATDLPNSETIAA